MLKWCWEEMGLEVIPLPFLVACGPIALLRRPSRSCSQASPVEGTLWLCFVVAVHPVEHPQEWPEGV